MILSQPLHFPIYTPGLKEAFMDQCLVQRHTCHEQESNPHSNTLLSQPLQFHPRREAFMVKCLVHKTQVSWPGIEPTLRRWFSHQNLSPMDLTAMKHQSIVFDRFCCCWQNGDGHNRQDVPALCLCVPAPVGAFLQDDLHPICRCVQSDYHLFEIREYKTSKPVVAADLFVINQIVGIFIHPVLKSRCIFALLPLWALLPDKGLKSNPRKGFTRQVFQNLVSLLLRVKQSLFW